MTDPTPTPHALDLAALRSDAEASLNSDPRFPSGGFGVYLNTTVLALIDSLEYEREATNGFCGDRNQWRARAEAAEANHQKAERKATDLFDIGIREKKRAIAAEAKIAAVRELVCSEASPGASQDYSTGYEHALARIADALDGTA